MNFINNVLKKNKIKLVVRTSKGKKVTYYEMPKHIVNQNAYLSGIFKENAQVPENNKVVVKYQGQTLSLVAK